MNNAVPITSEEISELRRDFDRLMSDLRGIRSDLSDLTGDAVRTAKAGAAEARHRIEHAVKAAGVKGKESTEAIEHQVAAHPYMSLAAALAVGMVIGFGLTRRG
jgi:ElaB/YqjD/DUF883 family membrane-anchored ribosome-binding protein